MADFNGRQSSMQSVEGSLKGTVYVLRRTKVIAEAASPCFVFLRLGEIELGRFDLAHEPRHHLLSVLDARSVGLAHKLADALPRRHVFWLQVPMPPCDSALFRGEQEKQCLRGLPVRGWTIGSPHRHESMSMSPSPCIVPTSRASCRSTPAIGYCRASRSSAR
ncbi:MAG TPA: hypothetical protein VK402_18070 [Blastococcus sp.]|nr:hypothetical protein [Blastococcus sp.]